MHLVDDGAGNQRRTGDLLSKIQLIKIGQRGHCLVALLGVLRQVVVQLYVWGAGDLSRYREVAQPGYTGHRGRDAAVESSGSQTQPAPLAEAPHANAAGINLRATA